MRNLRPIPAGVLVAVLLSFIASPAHAVGEVATRLSIAPLDVLTVGSEASVVVTLAQEDGGAVVDEPISLTIDGDTRPRRWTDPAGVATFNLPRDLLPGEHEVIATFAGRTNAYLGATARTVVEIVPYELAVETVPPLPGMVFELDGTRFEAGADGVARVGLRQLGEHTLTALPSAYRHPGERVEFSRWSNETFGPTITIRAPLEVRLQAGFDVSYQASLDFRDTDGNPVDQQRIEEVTLRNSIGSDIKLPNGRSRWYKAVRTIRRPAGLDTVPIRYTVEGVIVDGANVVNVGQQRFDVEPDGSWQIELLLYSIRMVPNDALFGIPVGDAVILTYPSGSTTRIEAVDGEFAADGLARGLYRVQVADAPGWSPVTPVALSRDQEVRVRVITYLDVGVVVMLGLTVALGLLHLGRPHLAPAAIAGAKGVVGVARNPRTLGALLARRRMGARPSTEIAPAFVTAREFVLPPVRAERSDPVYTEAHVAPTPQSTAASGAVPISQVIRTTLGSPVPASPAEASALPPAPPSLAAHVPAVAGPIRLVLAPSVEVAEPPAAQAEQTAPIAAALAMATTSEPAAPSAPAGDRPMKPRRTRAKEQASATKQPRPKARRTKDPLSAPSTTAGDAATRKRRRSPKPSVDASGVPESGKRQQATKPSGAKAPKKAVATESKPRRASTRTRSGASKPVESASGEVRVSEAEVQELVAESAAQTASQSALPHTLGAASRKWERATSVTAGARSPKSSSVNEAADDTPPAVDPSASGAGAASPPDLTASTEAAVRASDTAAVVGESTPAPVGPEQTTGSVDATAESAPERPSKARPARRAARGARKSKARSAKHAITDARPSKSRSAKKADSSVADLTTAEGNVGVSDDLVLSEDAPELVRTEPISVSPASLDQATSITAPKRAADARRTAKARASKAASQRAAEGDIGAVDVPAGGDDPSTPMLPEEASSSPAPTGESAVEGPSDPRSAKSATGARASKSRAARRAATPPEVIEGANPGLGAGDTLVAPGAALPTAPPQQSSLPVGDFEPPVVLVAPDPISEAREPDLDGMSRVRTDLAGSRPVEGWPPDADLHPDAESPRRNQVSAISSVAGLLPRLRMRADRAASARSAVECTGCSAALKPGARFCRRCGRVTAIGEREREGMS